MPTGLLYLIVGIFGLIVGSFLNVVILRDDRRKTILTGHSECPNCGHRLRWYELIPVISFVLQGGTCRSCKKPLSWQYPIVEVVTAGLAIFTAYYAVVLHENWLLFAGLAVAFALFLVVSVIDIRSLEIPVEYVVVGSVIATFIVLVTKELSLQDVGLGILVGGGSLAAVSYGWKAAFKQEGMGSGDIWLAAAFGAIVGYPGAIVMLLAAVFTGAILGVLALGLGKSTMQTALPFGPFLFFGLLISLIWGQTILQWYIL